MSASISTVLFANVSHLHLTAKKATARSAFPLNEMEEPNQIVSKPVTTYCPFKAPSRSVASSTGQAIELKRFEQRPGMSFVRAHVTGSLQAPIEWPARSFLQIAFVATGSLLISQGDQAERPCQTGDWILIKPAQASLAFRSLEPTQLLWIGFDQQASQGLTGFSDTLTPQLIDSTTPQLSAQPSSGRLLAIGHELAALEGDNTRERLLIEAKTLEWLALILDQPIFSPCRAITPLQSAREANAVAAAARFIEQRFSEDHSIANLSRAVHLNEFKLKRGFKECYGTTIFGYLRQVRMEKAREMLMQGNASVIETANSVGYSNPSHFARAFKQAFGINPSEAIAS
ncbi:AraC family transcriptional regulator [Pelagicoccus sp. SDUM812002]|uniref:helix-turn-helix transcriptional regulator n=1 Tax=Pelagicoccus sp. SDUM812002 TaxID=3041266 RepID=UPI00280ECBD2|nr:AraC family transcriptional regulator [Pelagicoccus sp. SDUM812002]MDQ8184827.1 AraC family transcriptional regulator [Pelagicoccus sp. SDUM812002]